MRGNTIAKIKRGRRNSTSHPKAIKETIKNIMNDFFSNKFDCLYEMGKILERPQIPNYMWEEIGNMNLVMLYKEI